jgi:hypothetical protein
MSSLLLSKMVLKSLTSRFRGIQGGNGSAGVTVDAQEARMRSPAGERETRQDHSSWSSDAQLGHQVAPG